MNSTKEEIIALHETGHFIALYAMGLYDEFTVMTITPNNGTYGQTVRTGDSLNNLSKKLSSISTRLLNDPGLINEFNNIKDSSKDVCLPHVAFFFGGGAIDNYKNRENENRNRIDTNNLSQKVLPAMFILNLNDKCLTELKEMTYNYLHKAFDAYKDLISIVSDELLEKKAINKEMMNKTISTWESQNNTNNIKRNLENDFKCFIKAYNLWWNKYHI